MTIHHFETLDSTQNKLREFFDNGSVTLANFDAILTDFQTKGRGRNQHLWEAPRGSSLFSSTYLQLPFSEHNQTNIFMVTPVVALALRKSLAEFLLESEVGTRSDIQCAHTNNQVTIKWPNDVLVNGKKIAGILVELLDIKGGHIALGVGVGVNLLQTAKQLPNDAKTEPTSLLLEGAKITPEKLFTIFIENLKAMVNDYLAPTIEKRAIVEQFRQHNHKTQRLEVTTPNGEVIVGGPQGISDDFALIIRSDDGKVHEVMVGDVHAI